MKKLLLLTLSLLTYNSIQADTYGSVDSHYKDDFTRGVEILGDYFVDVWRTSPTSGYIAFTSTLRNKRDVETAAITICSNNFPTKHDFSSVRGETKQGKQYRLHCKSGSGEW